MEKLIELLNEYKKIKGYDGDTKIISYNTNTLSFTNGYSLLDYEIVIGKRYGFIKRLVDNDKIDLDKLKDNTSFTMLTHSIGLGCEWHTAHEGESILRAIGTNAIIAYLSIQDEPIEFLISILK